MRLESDGIGNLLLSDDSGNCDPGHDSLDKAQ
jgi:hypothetical protein